MELGNECEKTKRFSTGGIGRMSGKIILVVCAVSIPESIKRLGKHRGEALWLSSCPHGPTPHARSLRYPCVIQQRVEASFSADWIAQSVTEERHREPKQFDPFREPDRLMSSLRICVGSDDYENLP